MARLSGRTAIVTGGAKGIGRHYSLALAAEGARVMIADISDGTELAQEIAAKHGANSVTSAIADVSDESSVKSLVAAAMERFGRIDVLVNNAALFAPLQETKCTEIDADLWDKVMAVNLRGPFLITQAVLPIIIKQKSGSIINVSSSIGRGAYANFIAYATSKWGLEGFTQTLAAELRSSHIRVNSVEPGYVATKLTGFHGSKPDSVTDVFVYLASDEAKGITGKMLSSSGWKSQIK